MCDFYTSTNTQAKAARNAISHRHCNSLNFHPGSFLPSPAFLLLHSSRCYLLWPPYVIGQAIIFYPVVSFFFLSSFSPRLISPVGDWMYTSTHGVTLVRILVAGLKRAARGSLKVQDAKNRQKFATYNYNSIKICKQISTPPQPYQKIPDIYFLYGLAHYQTS